MVQNQIKANLKGLIYIAVVVVITYLATVSAFAASNGRHPYGVFIGVDKLDYDKLGKYDKIVIDAEYFSKAQIKKLKKAGVKQVYSYLNVGSIEEFRSYYDEYKDLTLSRYENWDDEYWIDVSSKRWQKFIISKAKKLRKKGVDGMFIDNCDVYYLYPRKEIYNGLVTILKAIRKDGSKIMINGGDEFVKKRLSGKGKKLIDAVNQESVYTSIDFENDKFVKNKKSERKYFTDYLNKIKKSGVKIYVLEYSTNKKITKSAKKYSKKNGWKVYVSPRLNLD